MNQNLLKPAIFAATILICTLYTEKVRGSPISTDRNEHQTGIYSQRSWINNDGTGNTNRNTWIIDLNDGERKDQISDGIDCNKESGSICSDQKRGYLRVPVKKEVSPWNGWGAGGMPFNILYMKNPKSAKSTRSQLQSPSQPAMYGIIAEPLRSQPIMGPVPQAQQQFPGYNGPEDQSDVRNSEATIKNTSLLQGATSIRTGRPRGRSSNGSIFEPSRRHYSILPHLFVLYGWGPASK